MIRYTSGNLLEAHTDALVNTVNEVGVMGKGIALMFRDAFPENTREYEAAAKARTIKVGHMFVTRSHDLVGPRWIINFPTKKHWRNPSKLEWIREGLEDLVRVIRDRAIESIAIPPLGSGNGGLNWADVRALIEAAAAAIPDVDLVVYQPTPAYQPAPKASGIQKLTPARALIAELVRQYSLLGLDCSILEVQKLAWFLSRSIKRLGRTDPLRLEYRADRYGPYADQLRHLLDALDGSYLHCDKRLGDAGPLDLIWFDDNKREAVRDYLAEHQEYLPALEQTTALVEGFESPLGMELLATVDWLMVNEGVGPTVAEVRRGLERWPAGAEAAARKQALFDDRLIGIALDRLSNPPVVRTQAAAATDLFG